MMYEKERLLDNIAQYIARNIYYNINNSSLYYNLLRYSLLQMKKIIVVILVCSLLHGEMQQKYVKAQAGPAILMLACLAGAGGLLFYVWTTTGEIKKRAVVLQRKMTNESHYSNIATNVLLCPPNLTKAFPWFYEHGFMTNIHAEYRVYEIPIPDDWSPNYLKNSTAQIVL